MSYPSRDEIADLIFLKLKDNEEVLKAHFSQTASKIGYFYLDNLLPENIVKDVFNKFPLIEDVKVKKSLKEFKHVTAQMNECDPLLEEVVYAFQDKRIVDFISGICNYTGVRPDENLYAGGISMMGKGNYLHPHLDNSHDKDVKLYRVLNLLYYVTPYWPKEKGGNLELWSSGLKKDPITIHSKYNRLVVMATHKNSWHSVSKVEINQVRCCVSNYYFSTEPVDAKKSFHVTTFRARPGQYFKNQILKMDSFIRMGIRKIFKKGIRKNPHVYNKDDF